MITKQELLLRFEACEYSTKLLDKLLAMNHFMPVTDKIDIQEIQQAICYAKKYHGDQIRCSGEPYYSHPLEVAYLLAEYAAEEDKRYFRTDLFVSSILHDTIEDTELTRDMIAEVFGEIVANQVEGLTRIKAYGKITSEQLVTLLLLEGNKDVLMIKMIDRLHNMQTIKAKAPEKIKKILDETLRVFLFLSVYLEMPQIKNILIRICYEHLNITEHAYSLTGYTSVFAVNNYQLTFPIPQNDVNQADSLLISAT